ncbi:hypothetical protein DAERI_050198 [Deinococcus aerius]|uniref:Uncharacterized protein n=1 Tax=Deinococcus aerius TaxID=200253 RepID=A0A2I9CUX7_9DEIO|nr:hypothetical protein DAERI_050198 [Deinococcus aerius]
MLSAAKHLRNTLEGEALHFVQGDTSVIAPTSNPVRETNPGALTPDLVIRL